MSLRLEPFRILAIAVIFAAVLLLPVGLIAAEPNMVRTDPEEYPFFEDDLDGDFLADAIASSIEYYRKLPEDRIFNFGGDQYTARELCDGMIRFSVFLRTQPEPDILQRFMRKYAAVYERIDEKGPVDVLFTGYFEPEIYGSREKHGDFSHPIYGRPDNLITIDLSDFAAGCEEKTISGRYVDKKIIPYYDRRTIETTDVLSGHAEPIAWAADPVALFFLHVQGSGKIRLKDNSVINVQYDSTNGHPYRSIGKYLIDSGKISNTEMSMQAIGAYLKKHPEEIDEVFHYNPRYVFFRERPHEALGSIGVQLTENRSIALDQAISPAGALLYIETEKPVCVADGKIDKWVDFSRFALNQDTGTAIRGAGRADIFWGSGDYAETAAGYMKHRGRMYFIVIKP